MKTQFLTTLLGIILVSIPLSSAAKADKLTGFSDITVVSDQIVSLRYEGTEYVTANGDLMLGTTTRWYIPAATGVATLWKEGDPAPAATTTFGSPPKPEDPGSEGDNFYFRRNGANNMSSLDAINFQETIFPMLTDTIFVFERGGNDTGTYQAIFEDGTLGTPVAFKGAADYKDTGVAVGDQHAFGVVFTTDVRVKGVRITAPGHDCLSISAIPKPLDPKQSRDPQPADEATGVGTGAVLSWMPGEGATAHDVYLGTSLDTVSNASRTDPRGVLVSQGQAAGTYAPAVEYGRTYYWRVDEIAGAGTAPFKGAVWSFTTEAYAYPIENVTATASSVGAGMGPENTVNGSGLDAGNGHSTDAKQMWLSAGLLPNWIQFQFDKPYKLHELWVWNSNQVVESIVGFGARNVAVEYSRDGSTWTALPQVPEFARATGADGYTHNTTVPLGGVVARYVKLTINAAWGGLAQVGLSEVRFFYVPVEAHDPAPADAATDVALDAMLTWHSGREATSHQVYFGTNKQAVTDGTAPAATVTAAGFTPADLGLGATYYWRVDEVGAAATYQGGVWSFATKPYQLIDDFESYTDQDGEAIWQSWSDGLENPANGGSQVGNDPPPYAEQAIVHGGHQSMPLFYNNTTGAAYSEATQTFDSPQDWTAHGIKSLSLWFQGVAGNAGQLYVKVNSVKVLYGGPATDVAKAIWQVWNVDLSKAGNVSSVRTLSIGIEGTGAKGTLYFDDIRLLPATGGSGVVLTASPADSVQATGNDGTVQSINGIDVSKLVLGVTTTDYTKYTDHPAPHADDFNLGTYASLDEAKVITVKFAVPVTTVFVIERGGNDSGLVQPLDAAGNPLGEPQPFVVGNWSKLTVNINGSAAGAMVITASGPIWGIAFLPPAGGVAGIDPASISALPAQ